MERVFADWIFPLLSLTSFVSLDIAMDATRMSFRDNAFEVSIDKGTYDALAVSYYLLLNINDGPYLVRSRI